MNVTNYPKVAEVSGTWDKMHQIEPSNDQSLIKVRLFLKGASKAANQDLEVCTS
jgi:hypothetical protein